jgi:hypothetical protein
MKPWMRATRVLIFLVVLTFAVSVVGLRSQRSQQQQRTVTAYIVRFSAIGNTQFAPAMTRVVARTESGLEGSDRVPFQVLAERGCKVGDPVSAYTRGSSLIVNARLCGKGADR